MKLKDIQNLLYNPELEVGLRVWKKDSSGFTRLEYIGLEGFLLTNKGDGTSVIEVIANE